MAQYFRVYRTVLYPGALRYIKSQWTKEQSAWAFWKFTTNIQQSQSTHLPIFNRNLAMLCLVIPVPIYHMNNTLNLEQDHHPSPLIPTVRVLTLREFAKMSHGVDETFSILCKTTFPKNKYSLSYGSAYWASVAQGICIWDCPVTVDKCVYFACFQTFPLSCKQFYF